MNRKDLTQCLLSPWPRLHSTSAVAEAAARLPSSQARRSRRRLPKPAQQRSLTRAGCLAGALVASALVALACSPEASRVRSGGPGADVGNRGSTVELHGKRGPDQMFYQTPRVGQGVRQ